MENVVTYLLGWADKKFIPDSLREHLDEYYRARMLVMVCIVSSSVLTPFIFVRFWLQGPQLFSITMGILVSLVLLTPAVLRIKKSIAYAGMFLVTTATTCLLLMAYNDGGLRSPTIFALLLAPVFAVFFGNTLHGVITTIFVTISMIALGIATQNDIVSPPYFDGDLYMWTIGASALALMIILVSIAYMFIAWQRNVQQGLLSANQAKDDFLSGMSHELRTPLNSMLGFTDVMLHEYAGPLNDQQRDHLRMILDSGDHLTELVEDLVNLTNIDAGKVELTLEPLDFGQLVKDCTASFGVAAQQKCITIDIDIMDIPELVDADDTRIRQVLTNLLSNAIKFSPENGRVGVSVRRNGPILEISVSDDGPGIATENRERIFEKFYQVDSALAGKTVGSGLGLYIARRLAELHGGRLNLAKSDSGTTFVLTLPIAGAAT